MTGLLEGVKVVELGLIAAIPLASMVMADWGAEVIKVEPLSGEMLRGQTRNQGVDIGEIKWGIEMYNRNKKGLALDLKKESGRDILYQLIQKVDVFMSNYTVSSLDRLKLDYHTLSQLNPRLIYAIVTAFGRVGPDKDKTGGDVTAAWPRSGLQHILGNPGSPVPIGRHGTFDSAAAIHALSGVLAALLRREKTGRGEELEVSLFQAGAWALAWDIQHALVGLPMPVHDRSKSENPMWNSYRAKDDRWFLLGTNQFDRWPDFYRVIERPELANDPRFNNAQVTSQHCGELIRIIDEVFATKNRKEWEKRFKEANLSFERIETPLELTTDPQALANDFFVEVEHPKAGKIKLVNSPVKLRQNPASVRTPAPAIGQHTEGILLDLGYNWDDIIQLREQGVIL